MKNVAAVRAVEPAEAAEMPGLPDEVQVALTDIAGVAREGLLALSVSTGLAVMAEMMEAEITQVVGPKHAKLPGRTARRHSPTPTSVVLGGRKVPISRPRARRLEGGEVHLESYETFASEDVLNQVVLERMLAGVATRRHRAAAEPVGGEVESSARSTSKSAVSRRFVQATQKQVTQLLSRNLAELDVAVLMIDGIIFADHCCVVALAITTDGTKVPVGLWLGDTENKTVVTALLADLVDRGLDAEGGLLVVIDGAKALRAAVKKVFGELALVQRCTLHKRKNVADHLPKEVAPWVDRKLAKAFRHEDPDQGRRDVLTLASHLEDRWPDAAGSLREGLDEMFTVRRLGVSDRLARTLTCTNAIESMISICRDTSRHVKRWRDGKMVRRWVAAGMLNAERSFRRIKGCKDMPTLVAALRAHAAREVTPACQTEEVA
jgi:putative transposase